MNFLHQITKIFDQNNVTLLFLIRYIEQFQTDLVDKENVGVLYQDLITSLAVLVSYH